MTLAGIAVLIVAVVTGIAIVVITHRVTCPDNTTSATPAAPATSSAASSSSTPVTPNDTDAEERALAARPMVRLPAQAAQPQAMTTATAGPEIDVPEPRVTAARWIPGGFPPTPEGALGQLKALNETALAAGDPQVYARAYRDMSRAGAPDPDSTGLFSLLTRLRATAELPATGSVSGLSAAFEVNHGQVKGTATDGTYVVVCVLGQFSVDYQGQVVTAGVGDCQAMRWTGIAWRIAAGTLAAPAPSAWPGSADAVKAGYRELS
ncbi:hypothetical protein [Haloechinothrix halophila]|uniref:hypothetical protein n=1 Tax=Haloechinothrix halophila TaxID=1069073 RepID=UPI0005548764|nr:hypothetical protein [Haloechinothrix halophila]